MEYLAANYKQIILSIVAVISIFLAIKNFQKVKKFLLEVKAELTKVAWSTRQELAGATIVVITITTMMAIFIGMIDLVLSKLLTLLFR